MLFYEESFYDPDNPFYEKHKHKMVNDFLKRVLGLNLYCVLGVINSDMDGHAIIMSGFHNNNFHIKNSWGDKYDVVSCDTFPKISLRGETFTCNTIRLLFPITPNMVLPDLSGTYKTIEFLTEFMDAYSRYKLSRGGKRKTKRNTSKKLKIASFKLR